MKQFKDPEFMGQFIDKYRDMRNLWEVKNPLYRNKPARKASLEKLLQFVKTLVPEADIDFVERKIDSLRRTYRKELSKIHASMRSGATAEEVYVPSLWYYNRMRFLEDQIEARESLSPLLAPHLSTLPSSPAEASEDQPGPSIQDEVEDPSWSQEEAMASSLTESQVPPLCPPSKRAKMSINLDDATAAFLRKATAAISTAPDGQEAFGCLTGNKLKQMEEDQRTLCEEIVLQALNKGTRGELTRKTHLCELDHAPPPPPPTSQPPHPTQQHLCADNAFFI
ncbi:uncharacterized protein LOC143956376 [Lithobates pipiens]